MTPLRFAPTPFSPGRYTNTLVRITVATHALQLVRESLTSSFTLDLHPDGTATLCRSWRYLATNRGPDVQTEERIREQLGYRGCWRLAGDGVQVELERDDTVCPPVGEYLELVPHHSDRWELVCRPVTALDAPGLEAPMLLCASPFEAPRFGEDEPHLVGGVGVEGGMPREDGTPPAGEAPARGATADVDREDRAGREDRANGADRADRADRTDPTSRRWIVLAAGEGVRIEVERTSVEPMGEERVQMSPMSPPPTGPKAAISPGDA